MKTIVAVEDDKALVDSLGRALEAYGYSIIPSHRVKGSFEQVEAIKPAFVFLDVMLPDGAGYQVSRRIRMDPGLYRTPILFISSLSEDPEIQYALQQGGDLYLSKPFTLKQLLEKVALIETLLWKIQQKDPVTDLPSLEALEREMDYRLLHQIPFTLSFFSITSFREYVMAKGKEQGEQAVRWIGQVLRQSVHDIGIEAARLAHVGSHHFLAIMPPESAEPFCQQARFHFDHRLPEFYKDFERDSGHIVVTKHPGTYSGYKLMDLEIDSVSTSSGFMTARDLVHHLNQIRRSSAHGHPTALFRFDQYKKW